MSMFIYRGGPGGRSIARLRLERDGSVTLTTGVMDVGEGSLTVLAQIAAEALSVPYEKVNVVSGDTRSTPQAPIPPRGPRPPSPAGWRSSAQQSN